ncbi:MAG: tripartite tricarboxylate transporter permease [Dehalococcoidales bacterium]|nr:tripartite tricarboxylate transporter permease [Dehalococcoidales bacterium]
MFEAYGTALGTLFQPASLLLLLVAVFIGLFVGILPGIGASTMVALLLPFISKMPADIALLLLIGIYAVVSTSGGITSILFNIPGEPSSAATCIDGYPMTQKGEGGRAISAAVTSSMAGSILPVFLALAMIPLMKPIIMAFGQPEMAMLVLLGISFIAALSGGSIIKGALAGVLGLLISFIGYHAVTGVARFTFNTTFFYDGINIVPFALGLFGISEMLDLGIKGETSIARFSNTKFSGVLQGIKDTWRHRWLWLRSTLIGYVIGIIPGIGGQVATWLCYGHAKQTSKYPEKFGTGTVEGVIAPEAADNAKESGSLLTTMVFGIPGSITMTLFLAAFILVGVAPGPSMITDNLPLSLTLLMGIALANIIGGIICLIVAPQLSKLATIHFNFIFPSILIVSLTGMYLATRSTWDFILLVVFGLIGLMMKRTGYSRPAFMLGFVLGAMFENYFLLSFKLYGPLFFFRPIPMVMLALIILVLAYPQIRKTVSRVRRVV